jgi:hypothetical protein
MPPEPIAIIVADEFWVNHHERHHKRLEKTFRSPLVQLSYIAVATEYVGVWTPVCL